MIALAACTLSSCGDDDGGNANDSGKGITAQYPSWLVGKWYDAEDDATFVFQSNGRGTYLEDNENFAWSYDENKKILTLLYDDDPKDLDIDKYYVSEVLDNKVILYRVDEDTEEIDYTERYILIKSQQ
jgi:hypothetical protein